MTRSLRSLGPLRPVRSADASLIPLTPALSSRRGDGEVPPLSSPSGPGSSSPSGRGSQRDISPSGQEVGSILSGPWGGGDLDRLGWSTGGYWDTSCDEIARSGASVEVVGSRDQDRDTLQGRRPAYLIASYRSDAEERKGGPIDIPGAVCTRRIPGTRERGEKPDNQRNGGRHRAQRGRRRSAAVKRQLHIRRKPSPRRERSEQWARLEANFL